MKIFLILILISSCSKIINSNAKEKLSSSYDASVSIPRLRRARRSIKN